MNPATSKVSNPQQSAPDERQQITREGSAEDAIHNEPTCRFLLAWQGPCGAKSVENGMCESHLRMTCCVCSAKQAVRQCDYQHGLICGAPLCETCEHH
jgi:hypothetical protein